MASQPSSLAPIDGFVAVIPAGGVGSRLWPLSRPDRPKFLLDLLGQGRSLLQATQDRLVPLASEVYVVTGASHAEAVNEQLEAVDAAHILAEPSPRDSMAAIALAAAVIEQRRGPAIMGSFAADQVITEVDAFADAVAKAVAAAKLGKVVTIGVNPTGPSEAFGYIESGARLEGADALAVAAFTEKPDAATAETFIATGRYFWNAGMFVVATDVLLGHLATLQPTLAAGVRQIAAAWDTPERDAVVAKVWPTLTKIAIDHAIAEPVAAMGGVAVVPAELGWSDVGDFASLAEMLTPGEDGVVRIDRTARAAGIDSPGMLVVGGTKPLAVVGIPGAVVIETADAILVTTRDSAQGVKSASAALEGS